MGLEKQYQDQILMMSTQQLREHMKTVLEVFEAEYFNKVNHDFIIEVIEFTLEVAQLHNIHKELIAAYAKVKLRMGIQTMLQNLN